MKSTSNPQSTADQVGSNFQPADTVGIKMQIAYVSEDFLPIFGVIPLVFCFLWYLIAGDIKVSLENCTSTRIYFCPNPILRT